MGPLPPDRHADGCSEQDAGFALAAGMLAPPEGDAALPHDVRVTGSGRGSLVRAAIPGADGPVGALCVHGSGRLLEREDALFMEAAASVIGTALARLDADRRLRHQALHDPLTGLPNRSLLADRLVQALARAQRDGSTVGAVFIDLDHFKAINDTFGHAAGDELLRQVAARLGAVVREGETLARFGGDEFVVVTTSDDRASLLPQAERLREALAAPFTLGERSFVLGAAATQGVDGATLVRDADAAMYRAKELGRGRAELHRAAPPVASAPRS